MVLRKRKPPASVFPTVPRALGYHLPATEGGLRPQFPNGPLGLNPHLPLPREEARVWLSPARLCWPSPQSPTGGGQWQGCSPLGAEPRHVPGRKSPRRAGRGAWGGAAMAGTAGLAGGRWGTGLGGCTRSGRAAPLQPVAARSSGAAVPCGRRGRGGTG